MLTPTRRLNVVFVTPWFPNPEHAYDGIFVREHARAVSLYHDVTLLHCQLRRSGEHRSRGVKLVPETAPGHRREMLGSQI